MSFAIALSDEQWELVADLFDPPFFLCAHRRATCQQISPGVASSARLSWAGRVRLVGERVAVE